jgi:hypothetical protein
MSTIREIEEAVRRLSPGEVVEFGRWFAEFEAAIWDKQIEDDSKAGRLDHLVREARDELRQDRCTDL